MGCAGSVKYLEVSGGLKVKESLEEVEITIHNPSKVKKRFTLTFTNCHNVTFPEGNPASVLLDPGEESCKIMVRAAQSGAWKWNYRWTARGVFKGMEDDPKAFTDLDFPPDSSSVGSSQTHWTMGQPEVWLRARHLGDPNEVLLFDRIQCHDVLQGDLGDCWLMSALASLAEYPEQIRQLFKSKDIMEDGKYEVQLYDIEFLGWKSIIIDEFIPCTLKEGVPEPTFAKPLGEEIWVLLLEKAVAKFCGSYGVLSGGTVAWAFQLLTGETEIVSYQKLPEETWRRRFMNREKQIMKGAKNPLSCWWNWNNSDVHELKHLFEMLQHHLSEKHMVTCMISKTSDTVEEATKKGLYKGHFYSLLQAREEHLDDGNRVNLVMLRNPWGSKEWQGEWSDASERWAQNPQLKKRLHSDRVDGVFWISLEDWAAMFSLVFLCPSCVSPALAKVDTGNRSEEKEDTEEDAVAFPE